MTTHPDPELVELAITRLSEWEQPSRSSGWKLSHTKEFPKSTVFFIDVAQEGGTQTLAYKIRKGSRTTDWFERNIPLVNPAVRKLRDAGLRAAPILAHNADELCVITLFVPGTALQQPDSNTFDQGSGPFLDIGKACRILESVAAPFMDARAVEQLWDRFERRLRSTPLNGRLRTDIEAVAKEIFTSAISEPEPLVMAHTEMSHVNILVEDGRPGFIDLNFAPALRGYTLAKILFLVEYTDRFLSESTRRALDALIEGYGPSEWEYGLKFARIERLLRGLPGSSMKTIVSPRRQRVMRELSSIAS